MSAKRFLGCMGGSRFVRICGDAEDVDVAVVDLDDEEHVDPAECDRAINLEEVPGSPLSAMVAGEYPSGTPPPRSRRTQMERY